MTSARLKVSPELAEVSKAFQEVQTRINNLIATTVPEQKPELEQSLKALRSAESTFRMADTMKNSYEATNQRVSVGAKIKSVFNKEAREAIKALKSGVEEARVDFVEAKQAFQNALATTLEVEQSVLKSKMEHKQEAKEEAKEEEAVNEENDDLNALASRSNTLDNVKTGFFELSGDSNEQDNSATITPTMSMRPSD